MGRNNADFFTSCNDCGGSGTEIVSYNEDSFSGDNDCPTCKGSGKSK